MFFSEPTIELVRIDTRDMVNAFSCNETTSSTQPSGEDCVNCDAAMNNCSDPFEATKPITKIETWETTKVSHRAVKKSEPQNVVGFDMTFDR